jgi:hypothetical protein
VLGSLSGSEGKKWLIISKQSYKMFIISHLEANIQQTYKVIDLEKCGILTELRD